MSDFIIRFHHLHNKCIIRVAGLSMPCQMPLILIVNSKIIVSKRHLRLENIKISPRESWHRFKPMIHTQKGWNHSGWVSESVHVISDVSIRVSVSTIRVSCEYLDAFLKTGYFSINFWLTENEFIKLVKCWNWSWKHVIISSWSSDIFIIVKSCRNLCREIFFIQFSKTSILHEKNLAFGHSFTLIRLS